MSPQSTDDPPALITIEAIEEEELPALTAVDFPNAIVPNLTLFPRPRTPPISRQEVAWRNTMAAVAFNNLRYLVGQAFSGTEPEALFNTYLRSDARRRRRRV